MIISDTAVETSRPDRVLDHFIIGQDAAGHWLARATKGTCGGLFKSCQSAIRFVEFETGHKPGAYEISSNPLSLTF